MEDCSLKDECANFNVSCYKCFNFNMYQEKKQRQGLRSRSLTNKQKKSGIDFENRGAKRYNQAVKQSKDIARRQIASGAISSFLGDMITEEELTASLAEFKER